MTLDTHVLTTERLQLRPIRPEDGDALLTLFRTPYIRRYLLDDMLVDLDWVDGAIGQSDEMFQTLGLGLWSLRVNARSDLIGFCGFLAEGDEPRLIYGLSEALSGQGLAREAAIAVTAFAYRQGLNPIRASVDGENTASRALLEALGFEIVRTSTGRLGEVFIYERRDRPAA